MTTLKVKIYTDGACSGNPGPMGAGIILQSGEKTLKKSIFLGEGTNNKAEFLSVVEALRLLKYPEITEITLYTDSNLVLGIFSGWKIKAHPEIVAEIRQLANECKTFKAEKVTGHSTDEYNNLCDALAKKAVKTKTTTVVP